MPGRKSRERMNDYSSGLSKFRTLETRCTELLQLVTCRGETQIRNIYKLTGCIPSLLTVSTFPSLVSFLSPSLRGWRDARKWCEERGNKEICFQRNETSFPLKWHVKRHPFLMAAAADHSWINCQLALTAVETFDAVCVCTCAVFTARAAVFSLCSLLPV